MAEDDAREAQRKADARQTTPDPAPLRVRPWGSLNWPNRISILRLLLVAPFIVLLLNQAEWGRAARYAALGIFAIMALSDFLDGMLARKLNAKTRLGAILDPLADKVLIICAAVLLSLPESGVLGYQQAHSLPFPAGYRLPNWIVVFIVGKDLWVMIGFVVIYLVTDRFRVLPTIAGKASTVAQLSMVIAVLVAPDLDWLHDGLGRWTAQFFIWAVAVFCVLAVISYTRLGLSFIAEGQKPLDDHNQNGKK